MHLQTGVPFAVVIVKSSPPREKAFSFMWRTRSSGKQNCGWTPRGGLNAMSGAMVSTIGISDELNVVRLNIAGGSEREVLELVG